MRSLQALSARDSDRVEVGLLAEILVGVPLAEEERTLWLPQEYPI